VINVKNITRRLFYTVIVVFMGLFTVNNTLFLHTHILPGGEIVIHAHPFKAKTPVESSDSGVPGNDHTHNTTQFTLFGQVQQVIPWMILVILLIISFLITHLYLPVRIFPGQISLTGSPTRGPPVVS